jgi:hypothetical protein
MSEPAPTWPTGVGEVKTQVDRPPAKSHQQIFAEVFAHAKEIVRLSEMIPTECEPREP